MAVREGEEQEKEEREGSAERRRREEALWQTDTPNWELMHTSLHVTFRSQCGRFRVNCPPGSVIGHRGVCHSAAQRQDRQQQRARKRHTYFDNQAPGFICDLRSCHDATWSGEAATLVGFNDFTGR